MRRCETTVRRKFIPLGRLCAICLNADAISIAYSDFEERQRIASARRLCQRGRRDGGRDGNRGFSLWCDGTGLAGVSTGGIGLRCAARLKLLGRGHLGAGCCHIDGRHLLRQGCAANRPRVDQMPLSVGIALHPVGCRLSGFVNRGGGGLCNGLIGNVRNCGRYNAGLSVDRARRHPLSGWCVGTNKRFDHGHGPSSPEEMAPMPSRSGRR